MCAEDQPHSIQSVELTSQEGQNLLFTSAAPVLGFHSFTCCRQSAQCRGQTAHPMLRMDSPHSAMDGQPAQCRGRTAHKVLWAVSQYSTMDGWRLHFHFPHTMPWLLGSAPRFSPAVAAVCASGTGTGLVLCLAYTSTWDSSTDPRLLSVNFPTQCCHTVVRSVLQNTIL